MAQPVDMFVLCNGIQKGLGLQIPGTGFQSLSMELEFWIPIVSGIPESLSCIPGSTLFSRILESSYRRKTFPNPDSLTWDDEKIKIHF